MPLKYILKKETEGGIVETEYKTLKQISEDLGVELHIIRKINQMTEGRVTSHKPHHTHRDLYNKLQISTIKKTYNI